LTEVAQAKLIAKENTDTFKSHTHNSDSSTFPLRTAIRNAYDSLELHDLEPLHPKHTVEDYDTLLPSLKCFYYLETKLIAAKSTALETSPDPNETPDSLFSLKAQLISSTHILIAQEASLKVTTLSSLIEYSICSLVSAALGILVYVQGIRDWTTIASLLLFGLCVFYKSFSYAAYVREMWFDVGEADYRRLVMEARGQVKEDARDIGER
jgi:hypothetical protein